MAERISRAALEAMAGNCDDAPMAYGKDEFAEEALRLMAERDAAVRLLQRFVDDWSCMCTEFGVDDQNNVIMYHDDDCMYANTADFLATLRTTSGTLAPPSPGSVP